MLLWNYTFHIDDFKSLNFFMPHILLLQGPHHNLFIISFNYLINLLLFFNSDTSWYYTCVYLSLTLHIFLIDNCCKLGLKLMHWTQNHFPYLSLKLNGGSFWHLRVINLLVTLFVLEEKQNLRYGVKKKGGTIYSESNHTS